MLSIQDVGIEILGDNPRSFYAMCGPEYGIKQKYIRHLSEFYSAPVKECQSMLDLIDMMSTRHLIPLKPMVYVVRYDEEFISKLNESVAKNLLKTNISGTIICIYQDAKHASKLDKYLPNNTVSIDNVSPTFLQKYLKSDFPELNVRFINYILHIATDYGQASTMCNIINMLSEQTQDQLTESEIMDLFGYKTISTERQLQLGVASRNFKYLLNVLDNYQDDYDRVLYTILQTMIELDKLISNPKIDSHLKNYIKLWRAEDVYYMFMHTYASLKQLRSASVNAEYIVLYLFALLQFQTIPDLEVLNNGIY